MKNIVIFDIDGTIADCEHRRHFVTGEKQDWKSFFYNIPYDTVIEHVVTILELFYKEGYTILLMSGRDETTRTDTEEWLEEHAINYHGLFMRAAGDSRDDTIVKKELFEQHLAGSKDNILLVVDDRPKVIRMWRELGLKVLDCGDGVEF